VARYRAHYDGGLLKPLLLEQSLWALLQYRLASGVHRSALPRAVKAPLLLLAVLGHKVVEVLTGISLPYRAELLPGLYIGHFGPLLVNDRARIGTGCNLSQGVTIGVSGRGRDRGAPVIGDRVYVGPGAVVSGRITVGDDVVVGANSFVGKDVAAGTTVIGVPARRASQEGTAGMGLHMRPDGAGRT
jgi:serine O-acetyltransferase